MQSSDNGIEQAYQWLLANRPTLSLNNIPQGYNSGYATPVWTSAATWTNSVNLGADAAGNTISYQIHRMCNCADTLYNHLRRVPAGKPVRAGQPHGHGGAPAADRGRKFYGRLSRILAGSPGLLPHHRAHAGSAQHRELRSVHGGGRALRHAEYFWRAWL